MRSPLNSAIIKSLLFISIGFYSSFAITANGDSDETIDNELKTFLQKSLTKDSSFDDKFDAQVWLLAMQNPIARFIKNEKEQLILLERIFTEARRKHLKPEIVLAVIETESSFNSYAISRAGAQGLMQVMPFWKNEIGRLSDNLTNIETNLSYGCAILKFYLDKENGNIAPALARYNGSYGRTVYSDKVLKVWNKHWRHGSLDEK